MTASPPPALIAQHGAQTTWNLLRFLLAGLLEALQDQAFLECPLLLFFDGGYLRLSSFSDLVRMPTFRSDSRMDSILFK